MIFGEKISTQDVIDKFVNRKRVSGRSSNVSFSEPNKIYSYGVHYLLAEFIDDSTLWVNDLSPSVTTSRHVNLVINAAKPKSKWHSNNLTVYLKSETDLNIIHDRIIKYYIKLRNPNYKQFYVLEIIRLWEVFNNYLNYKGLTAPLKFNKYKKLNDIVTDIYEYKDNNKRFIADDMLEIEKLMII